MGLYCYESHSAPKEVNIAGEKTDVLRMKKKKCSCLVVSILVTPWTV